LRYRVAIRFEIEGDLRFVSHHDTMRLCERALARTRLPIRYSAGFNPRPRLSLPLPRAVGVASQCELLVVEMCEPTEPAQVLARLAEQMPEGLRLLEAWRIEAGSGVQPGEVSHELALSTELIETVVAAVERLLAAEHWPVGRESADGKSGKTIDLRAYVASASVDAGTLRWTARVTPGGTMRISEMLGACGLEARDWHHRVKRTHVIWSASASAISAEPSAGQSGDADGT
jgi:radical SAM-linked protein